MKLPAGLVVIFVAIQLFFSNAAFPQDHGFKIITYNVWQGYLDGTHPRFPCYASGEERKKEIYNWLKEQDADVVVFQELIDYPAEKLQKESASWGHHDAVVMRENGMTIGITSRYPIRVREIVTEGMHHGLIYCQINGVDIVATHLWPRFDEKILEEVQIAGKRVNESLSRGTPVIVLGDFNAFSPQDDPFIDSATVKIYRDRWKWKLENGRPSYRVIRELLDHGMKDLCTQFEKNNAARHSRYDFIFASSGLAEKCTDATHYQDEELLKLSDHFPVSATFDLDGPRFSFGVIADIQYADAEKSGKRDYRNALDKLEICMNGFNRHDLAFTVTLGDMIDRDYSGFDKTLPILGRSKVPVYNVIGNHDFAVEDQFKKQVKGRLQNKKGYFDFQVDSFLFVVLDGTDLSTFGHKKGSRQYELAVSMQKALAEAGGNNAYSWNGGIGSAQLRWLGKKLQQAAEANLHVILFCHWPLLPENGTQLWNNREVLSLIDRYDNVIAWISGHHHAGGYLESENIHHLTIKGMVEARSETSCGIMDVYDNKLVLRGYGDQPGYSLEF